MREEVGRVDVQFPSYVDDLHCGLYDRRVTGAEEAKCERMQELVARVQWVVAEVATEQRLPLAADKGSRWYLEEAVGEKRGERMGLPRR